MRTALVLALALALTATACTGDDDGGADYVAIDDIEAAYKDAYCTYLARCGLFPDAATCVRASLAVVATIDPNVIAAVHAGRIIYNGNNVRTCFDAVASDSCDQTDENGRIRVPACGAYFHGTVAGGGECVLDQECISQNCSGSIVDATCSRGTCIGDTPPVSDAIALGMPCSSNQSCVDGAYCPIATSVCTPLLGSGATCTGSAECGYGLSCVGPSGMRTCQPLPALGETCRLDLPCRDEGQYCSAQQLCTQVGVAGVPCTSNVQCSPYYRCDTTAGTCVQGPGPNESCASGSRCFDADTYCSDSTLTCVPLDADGAPCTNDLHCTSGHCDFNAATPVCAPPPLCT